MRSAHRAGGDVDATDATDEERPDCGRNNADVSAFTSVVHGASSQRRAHNLVKKLYGVVRPGTSSVSSVWAPLLA